MCTVGRDYATWGPRRASNPSHSRYASSCLSICVVLRARIAPSSIVAYVYWFSTAMLVVRRKGRGCRLLYAVQLVLFAHSRNEMATECLESHTTASRIRVQVIFVQSGLME